MQERTRTDQY